MILNIPKIILKSAWKYLVSDRVCYVFQDYADLKKNFEVFSMARELFIYAGELYSDFYNDPDFVKNLKLAVQGGCQVQTIFGPALYAENDKFFALACNPQFKFSFYKRSFRDEAHFKIILTKTGEKWAIIDRKHPIGAGSEDRGQSVMLLKGYDREINALLSKFKKQREQSKPIKPCDIVNEFKIQRKSDREFYGFIAPCEEEGVKLADPKEITRLEQELKPICNI
jgi:hypothetical protein